MARRWLQIILIAVIPCGWLCQTARTQVPTKIPPVAKSGPSQQGDGREWINPPPEGSFSRDAAREIEKSHVYEIVTSKGYVTVADLKDRAYLKITAAEAADITGPYFRCPTGKTPYLVRAVYGFGGTGNYSVLRFGRKVLVEHGSLGRTVHANKSALVVNLDFEPDAVYTVVLVAE